MVREIEVGFLEMVNRCGSLLNRANKQVHHLAELLDNPFAYDSQRFRTEHEQLGDELAKSVKIIQRTKKKFLPLPKT